MKYIFGYSPNPLGLSGQHIWYGGVQASTAKSTPTPIFGTVLAATRFDSQEAIEVELKLLEPCIENYNRDNFLIKEVTK